MTRLPRLLSLLIVAAGLLSFSCGEEASPEKETPASADEFQEPFTNVQAYPVFASSEIVVGRNRLLIGLLDENDAPIGSPAIGVHIKFFDLAESAETPVEEADMEFVWSNKPYTGVYKTNVVFDSAGKWGAEVVINGEHLHENVKAGFEVAEEPVTPDIGETPPASDTPTVEDARRLSEISTDKNPDPRFYQSSIKEALRSREPFVVIFATPKFCQSQTCGPMLDVVKKVAKDFPKLTFINVEPYELPADPSNLRPVEAVIEWNLPSEPWTFVVDGRGKVAAKFEGALTPEELGAELNKL